MIVIQNKQTKGKLLNWKELYMKAAFLRESEEPSHIITAANIFHQIVYAEPDGTEDCSFWKGHSAIDLAEIYLAGVEGDVYYCEEDGNTYSDCYIEADLLKSYDLCRRALKHGIYDGVVIIAEIYFLLGDYRNAAKWYASAVKYGYKGAENAKSVLQDWLDKGLIDAIPEVAMEPGWDPVLEYWSPK